MTPRRKPTPSSKKRLCDDIALEDVPQRILERFLQRIEITPGCWNYPMPHSGSGYKRLAWSNGELRDAIYAHRLAFLIWRGPIPADMTVDHLCHNRGCCNPDHMQLASLSENSRRSIRIYRTACPHGHPYDERNTYVRANGHRVCRECNRLRMAEHWRRQRAEA